MPIADGSMTDTRPDSRKAMSVWRMHSSGEGYKCSGHYELQEVASGHRGGSRACESILS
jgi:hypothetical protein